MNYFKIASILSKTVISQGEMKAVREELSVISNDFALQLEFYRYCEKWKLAPWIGVQLVRHRLIELLSPEVADKFSQMHAQTRKETESRNIEMLRVLEEFKKNGIDVIVLKGNVYSSEIYKDTGYKKMNDFDILIHLSDWEKVQEIYAVCGFLPLGFGWSGEKHKPASYSHTGVPFISRNLNCIIGTQWGLKSPSSKYKVNINEVWLTALPYSFSGVVVKKLSPEYNLLHLTLHMGVYKCGIRDCMDVYNTFPPDTNPERLKLLFTNANALDKAWFTLTLADKISNSIPKHILATLKPSERTYLVKRLEKRLNAINSNDIHISYNDYFQDIEKKVIYFNLFREFHTKTVFYFKIMVMVFWPKMETALQLSDAVGKQSAWNKIKARLKAPYYVLALIAEEIGWKFTFLLLLKVQLTLLFSLKNYLYKDQSYFDFLIKNQVDPKDIQKAVKNIQ